MKREATFDASQSLRRAGWDSISSKNPLCLARTTHELEATSATSGTTRATAFAMFSTTRERPVNPRTELSRKPSQTNPVKTSA